jgi:hypothetical protein
VKSSFLKLNRHFPKKVREKSENRAKRNTGDHCGSVDQPVSSAYFQGFPVAY